jgi:DNA topoisomerase-1
MSLIIVESPSKCAKIAGYMGFGYKVLASLGHIRHLKEDLDAVGLERDFEAKWESMKEKAQSIQKLKDAAKQAHTIYLASDDDREGELIAYSVCILLKLNPETTKRIVFHEITESAVKNAIANPRHLDMSKVQAAEARAILDMMVGFTISPLLWKSVGPALSAGRCQTPALRLVVEKEKDVQNFKSESSWKIHGTWTSLNQSGPAFQAHLTDELQDEDSAMALLETMRDSRQATVLKSETTNWSYSPPLPLITSTLQQQASSLMRSKPKETMSAAQKLYEAGHITYMRTDKAVLSEEATKEAQEYVATTYGEEYVALVVTKAKGKAKSKSKDVKEVKAQEAHEAIRPTHINITELPQEETWSPRERKLYHLIWLRTIQSVMAQARGEQHTVDFREDTDFWEDFMWRSTWRRTTFPGWRRISMVEDQEGHDEGQDQNQDQEIKESEWLFATSLLPATTLQWVSVQADPHETRAPQRYTEATLIKELEQKGIGRPSTFASLIATILDKEYVKEQSFPAKDVQVTTYSITSKKPWPPQQTSTMRKVGGEKDRLAPTPLGLSVLDFLLKHFDDLFQYNFTAQMESRLDKIAENEEEYKEVLRDTWSLYKDRYATLIKTKSSTTEPSDRRREFGDGLVAVLGKKGPLLLQEAVDQDKDKTVFYGWPDGIAFPALTAEQARAFAQQTQKEKGGETLGDYEGSPVVKRQGKFGWYVEWKDKKVSCEAEECLESIQLKLKEKATAVIRTVGSFEIRQGPYGPYMFKTSLKGPSRKFVSVPQGVDIQTISEKDLELVYKAGLDSKKAPSGYNKGYTKGRGKETRS